jgi:hypothetical protein
MVKTLLGNEGGFLFDYGLRIMDYGLWFDQWTEFRPTTIYMSRMEHDGLLVTGV